MWSLRVQGPRVLLDNRIVQRLDELVAGYLAILIGPDDGLLLFSFHFNLAFFSRNRLNTINMHVRGIALSFYAFPPQIIPTGIVSV